MYSRRKRRWSGPRPQKGGKNRGEKALKPSKIPWRQAGEGQIWGPVYWPEWRRRAPTAPGEDQSEGQIQGPQISCPFRRANRSIFMGFVPPPAGIRAFCQGRQRRPPGSPGWTGESAPLLSPWAVRRQDRMPMGQAGSLSFLQIMGGEYHRDLASLQLLDYLPQLPPV